MDDEIVKRRVEQSLDSLYNHDQLLLEYDSSEWSITHKLAEYLQENFNSYHVDCEYNRHGGNNLPKRLANFSECGDDKTNQENRNILPDIVVHERGCDSRNLLVIEMKKNGSGDIECDRAKLQELTKNEGDFEYEMGLFIKISTGEDFRDEEPQCEWF